MLTLYHAPKTRSARILWLLEEIGEPYAIEHVPIRRRDGTGGPGPDYLKIHPHGKVPAIAHDGQMVFESAAICLYLTDAFPNAKLGPQVGDAKRGAYLTWLAYFQGVVELAVTARIMNWSRTPQGPRFIVFEEMEKVLAAALDPGPYILGENFSAADVLYGTVVRMLLGSKLAAPKPAYLDYVKRLDARPAFHRAQAKDQKAAA